MLQNNDHRARISGLIIGMYQEIDSDFGGLAESTDIDKLKY